MGFLILTLICSFSFFIVLVLYIIKKASASKSYNTEDIQLVSPVHIGFLKDYEIEYRHIIAVLMHFIDNRYVKLKKIINEDKSIKYELTKQEHEIFNNKFYYELKNVNLKNIKSLLKYKVSITDIYIIDRLIFNDYNKIDIEQLEEFYGKFWGTAELQAKVMYANKLLAKEMLELNIISKKGFTKFGEKEQEKWNNFASKLKKDTLMPERNIEHLVLWGENMVYGIALGVCEMSIKDVNKIYKGSIKFI